MQPRPQISTLSAWASPAPSGAVVSAMDIAHAQKYVRDGCTGRSGRVSIHVSVCVWCLGTQRRADCSPIAARSATRTPCPRPPSFVQRRSTVITESFRNKNGGETTIAILLPAMGKNVPVKTVKMDVSRLFSFSSIQAAAPELLNALARKLSAENEHFDHTTFSEMAACSACSKFSICVHELRFDKCAVCELTLSCVMTVH